MTKTNNGICRSEGLKTPFPHVFKLTVALWFIIALGFSLALPFVSVYLYKERNVEAGVIGIIFFIVAITRMLGQISGGEIADRFGRKTAVRISLGVRFLSFTALGIMALTDAPIWALATAIVIALSTGALIQPPMRAIITDTVPPERRIEAFGITRVSVNLGWAAGLAIGGGFLTWGYGYLFLVSAGMCFAVLIFLPRFPETLRKQPAANQSLFSVYDIFRTMRNAKFAAFCIITFVFFLIHGQMTTTFAMYSTGHLGIESNQMGWIFVINGILVAIFQWPISVVFKRGNPYIPLTVGAAIFGAGYLITGFAGGWYGLALAIIVVTIGEMLSAPTSLSIVSDFAEPGKIGRYMGVNGFSESIGQSLGPVTGAFVLGLFLQKGEPVLGASLASLMIWGILGSLGIISAIGFLVLGIISRRGQAVK